MTECIYPQTLAEYLKESGEGAASNAIASMLDCDNEHLVDSHLPDMPDEAERVALYDFVREHEFYIEATQESIESETEHLGALLVSEFTLDPATFNHESLETSLGHDAWAMGNDLTVGWSSDSLAVQLLSDEQLLALFRSDGDKSVLEPCA